MYSPSDCATGIPQVKGEGRRPVSGHNSTQSSELAEQQNSFARDIHEAVNTIEENVRGLGMMAKQNISGSSDLSQYSVQLESLVAQYTGAMPAAPEQEDDIELF